MAKLTYTNMAGRSLSFGESAPFLVTKIDGLGSPTSEIHRQKSPGQDGATVVGSALEERNLVLEGVILSRDREKDRRRLARIFNPKQGGRLRFERGPTIKEISCEVERVDFPSAMQDNHQPFLISLLCPDPFWRDTATTKAEVAIWRGAFEFPLEIVPEGIEMGFREPSLIVNINNPGDVPCGMRIRFKARAMVENPSLFNVNTREELKINKVLSAGEILTVNTHFANKRVESEKQGMTESAFQWLDLGSTFLQLRPGDNLFRYDADEGLDNLEVDTYFTPRYVGV